MTVMATLLIDSRVEGRRAPKRGDGRPLGGDLLLDVLVMTLQTMATVELVAEWQEMALAAVEGEWQEGTKDDDDGDGSGSGGRRGPKGEAAPANGIHVSSLPRRTDCSA